MKKSLLTLFVLLISLQSCDDNNDNEKTASVNLTENATHGQILTAKDGMSLYYFSKDQNGNSGCTGDCVGNWPLFYDQDLSVGEGLEQSDFSVIDHIDGGKQSTYKGWPLYYFVNDAKAGDTNGDNVKNVWFIAKPNYSLMYVISQLVGKNANGSDLNFTGEYVEGNGVTPYIVDFAGRTLYTFKKDAKNTNNFTAPDFSNDGVWPIFNMESDKIPSILSAADFGEIDVHGRMQTTYKGWPLYYYGQDKTRGDNYGINFPAAGVWPVANVNTVEAM